MRITTFASPRDALATVAERQGETLVGLSRFINRPDRYLDRFVRDNSPRSLPVKECTTLARYLGIDVRDLIDRDV